MDSPIEYSGMQSLPVDEKQRMMAYVGLCLLRRVPEMKCDLTVEEILNAMHNENPQVTLMVEPHLEGIRFFLV